MTFLRRELQAYVSACEQLLSDDLDPRLDQLEEELIIYYSNELSNKFDAKRNGSHHAEGSKEKGRVSGSSQSLGKKIGI
jgi:hypothetical protein